MNRTVEIRDEYIYYKGDYCGYLVTLAQEEFEIEDGIYNISVTKGSKYYIRNESTDSPSNYYFYSKEGYGFLYFTRFKFLICKKSFDKLFFALNYNDRYDIIVVKEGEVVKKEGFIDRMKKWLKS